MLALGQSQPWPEAMRVLTDQNRADASALIEYFQPLIAWLKVQNQGQTSGWTPTPNPLLSQ
jgi:peptidyl-dipeptidase A